MNYKRLFIFIAISCLMNSCGEKPNSSDVFISSAELRSEEEARLEEERQRLEAARLAQFEADKILEWNKIVSTAKSSFEIVKPIIVRKCFDCHDANTRLPIYGRLFRRINPVAHHQRDGLKALDFSEVFPLKAKGNDDQLTLLKSIRGSVVDRSMPLRIYTRFYRSRKIFNSDEDLLLAMWLDPLISDISAYNEKFKKDIDDGTMKFKALKVFKNKCFQCHANGSNRGRFGDMENLDELINTKYVNLNTPEKSSLYQKSLSGQMPIRRADRLTDEELYYVLEWIKEEKRSQN